MKWLSTTHPWPPNMRRARAAQREQQLQAVGHEPIGDNHAAQFRLAGCANG